ncbi:hypothetical protein MFLAVUS_006410 [Mucor flavus]|uniref:Uncharacterized protein n=1 Tax=Mucor flavus TaxID=439312 RepID=A0ABP9Z1F9_9FUNG
MDYFSRNCENFNLEDFFCIYGSNDRATSNELICVVIKNFASSQHDTQQKKAALKIQSENQAIQAKINADNVEKVAVATTQEFEAQVIILNNKRKLQQLLNDEIPLIQTSDSEGSKGLGYSDNASTGSAKLFETLPKSFKFDYLVGPGITAKDVPNVHTLAYFGQD